MKAKIVNGTMLRLLKRIGNFANEAGYSAFLVGGTVRDIILGRDSLDLDIVVEGDAIKLGEALAKELDGKLVTHRGFGTCSVSIKDGLRLDLATARKEKYRRPGAMPTVEFSSLEDDLSRRDFTINAMAIGLNKDNFGQLVDLFGGKRDLDLKFIRAMHDRSFIDDPTRIFRAVKLEQRLGFAIEAHTLRLINAAVQDNAISKVSRGRIRKEMALISKEKSKGKILKRLAGVIRRFKL
ncbi:MAG: hypothetical protein Q7S07_00610 [Candidatus Omnitrophota bacterium]|nr:hypothetical protein [Candidatus Omnitrophota bacterium]